MSEIDKFCMFVNTTNGLCRSPINTNDKYCDEIPIERCYYKQLQQLKYDVECAELRNKYDKEQFDNELQRLKQENENLKQECDLYKTFYRAKHDDLKNFLGQLKTENEELRKSNTSNAKAFLKENKEKHKLLDCLDEIEEILNKNLSYYEMRNEIVKFIKQVKEGE